LGHGLQIGVEMSLVKRYRTAAEHAKAPPTLR
jgi:hypothetical protein